MTVERLTAAQLSSVAELEKLCFSEPWSENALALLLTDAAIGAVCLMDDRVVAYGGMLLAPGEGQILNIATHPLARRQGAARAVIDYLLTEAKAAACTSVVLEVRASNAAAIALYTSHGFAAAGIRKRFYRNPTEDAFVMLCRL